MFMKKIYYYKSYDEDIIKSQNQDYKLKEDYKWIHTNIIYKFVSYLVYYPFLLFSLIYSKLVLKVSFVNKKCLKNVDNYFAYSNHTLEMGDVLNPILASFPKRPYAVCSSANLGIPFLGKIIPMLGGIVITPDIHKMIKFNKAVSYYAKKHPIFIYPEAHLWPYYTGIRPFNNSSFTYPVNMKYPVFVFTTTYQKKGNNKKPKIVIYIDGPYYPDSNLNNIEARTKLHDTVYNKMLERSKESNFEFVTYKKRD